MAKDIANQPVSEAEAAALFGVLVGFSPLVLAVSGGPDSTALMWLAARWRDGLEKPPKLIAVTVDHGLRKESAQEARDVAKLAKKLQVEHRTLRWTGTKPKTGIQEAARNARYRLLSKAANDAKAQHILTAHTLDDQAETILFRMARGSGVGGLAGMSRYDSVPVLEGRGLHLLRLLLEMPKTRLVATLKAAKVPYATDPSNKDPRFTRPRLRKLMPLLAKEGLTAARLGKLAHRAERIEEALFHVLNDVQLELCPGPWPRDVPASIDAEVFVDLPNEIGLRLLWRMISLIGNEGTPELGQIETLYFDLERLGPDIRMGWDAGTFRRTLAGAMITLASGKLTIEPAPPRRVAGKAGRARQGATRKAPFTKPR